MAAAYLYFALFNFSAGSPGSFCKWRGEKHVIELRADRIEADATTGGNDLFAYSMYSHIIVDGNENETDVTSRYIQGPTIPGPTIVINEGDEVTYSKTCFRSR